MLAMHAPDGFLTPSVALAAALISVAVLSLGQRSVRLQLGDAELPLAGLAAAFVFATQMLNFPVAAGTSGHLLGGALVATLVGPRVGALVVTVVVVVQALLFADGGVTALGYNVLNMAIVPAFGGWALFRLFRWMLPATGGGVVAATGLAAAGSVVLSAAAFSLEWLFGATAPIPFDDVFAAMVGIHAVIGIGEGVISAAVAGAVLSARPDLAAGAADVPIVSIRSTRVGSRPFVIATALITVVMAAVVSQFAADDPDGLERVALDQGFSDQAGGHGLGGSLLADYAVRGLNNEALSLAVAGVTGAAITLLVAVGLTIGRRRSPVLR